MKLFSRTTLLFCLALTVPGIPVCAADKTEPPDVSKLVQAGKATLRKLINKPASWTAVCQAPGEAPFEVKVTRDLKRQAWAFFRVIDGKPEPICRLIESNGLWHIMEHGRAAKYRPYEAEILNMSLPYLFISIADLRCIDNRAQLASAVWENRQENISSYHLPVPNDVRRSLEQAIESLEEMGTKNPDFLKRPDVASRIKLSRSMLANGVPLRVDETTGIMVEFKVRDMVISIKDFKWLENAPQSAFTLPTSVTWEDFSKPLAERDLGDYVMVSHDPMFKPGEGKPAADGYLLNLKTGTLCRLPYRGFAVAPCCFLKNRKEVVVTSFEIDGGAELLKLNLISGESTPLLQQEFRGSPIMFGQLSPDGRQIAALQMLAGSKVLDIQVRLIDVETGSSRPVGKAGNIGGPIAWLPDGDGLLLKRFETTSNPDAIEPRYICRLGLDGKLTDLRRGDWPIVLQKSRKILYEDDDTRLWHTCNLDGTEAKLFGNGLKGYGQPAVSPDETKIIFSHFEKGKSPKLMIFEMGKSDGKLIAEPAGFTGQPVWR